VPARAVGERARNPHHSGRLVYSRLRDLDSRAAEVHHAKRTGRVSNRSTVDAGPLERFEAAVGLREAEDLDELVL
jgi:hypothetical protein